MDDSHPYHFTCEIKGLPKFYLRLSGYASAYETFNKYKAHPRIDHLKDGIERMRNRVNVQKTLEIELSEEVTSNRSQFKFFCVSTVDGDGWWAEKITKRWGSTPSHWIRTRGATDHAELLFNREWLATFTKIYEAYIDRAKVKFYFADVMNLKRHLEKSVTECLEYIDTTKQFLAKL
jgi:hypothetical protein